MTSATLSFQHQKNIASRKREAIQSINAKRDAQRKEEQTRLIAERVLKDQNIVLKTLEEARKSNKKSEIIAINAEQKVLLLLLMISERHARLGPETKGSQHKTDLYQMALNFYAMFLRNLANGETTLDIWDIKRESVDVLKTLDDFEKEANRSLASRIDDIRVILQKNFAQDPRFKSIASEIDALLVRAEDLISSFEKFTPTSRKAETDWLLYAVQGVSIALGLLALGAMFSLFPPGIGAGMLLFRLFMLGMAVGAVVSASLTAIHYYRTGKKDFSMDLILGPEIGKIYSVLEFASSIIELGIGIAKLAKVRDVSKFVKGDKIEEYIQTHGHELYRQGQINIKFLNKLQTYSEYLKKGLATVSQIRALESDTYDIRTFAKLAMISLWGLKKFMPKEMTRAGGSAERAFFIISNALQVPDHFKKFQGIINE